MSKCELCPKDETKFTVGQHTDQGIKATSYCSHGHMIIDVLKKFSKHVKAETGTTTSRLYLTATAVVDKLVKALEREWVKTDKKKANENLNV